MSDQPFADGWAACSHFFGAELAEKDARIAELEAERTISPNWRSGAAARIAELEAHIANLDLTITMWEQTKVTLDARIAELEAELAEAESTIERLEAENDGLYADIERLQREAWRPDDVVIIDGQKWRVVRFGLGARPFYAWGEFLPVDDPDE